MLVYDPKVKILLSNYFSNDKFGFIEIDINANIKKIFEYLDIHLDKVHHSRKKFFHSSTASASQIDFMFQ